MGGGGGGGDGGGGNGGCREATVKLLVSPNSIDHVQTSMSVVQPLNRCGIHSERTQ
jgi:hypothetical protein